MKAKVTAYDIGACRNIAGPAFGGQSVKEDLGSTAGAVSIDHAAEKAALDMLDTLEAGSVFFPDREKHARTLKAMLAEPRLPAEPGEAALYAMEMDGPGAEGYSGHVAYGMYVALYAHLTRPETKTEHFKRWLVVWKRGEHGPFADEDEARRCAKAWNNAAVIELTGAGEVPND